MSGRTYVHGRTPLVLRLLKRSADRLSGGKADRVPISSFDPAVLREGAKIEREHTSDPALQKEIASDHVQEAGPGYYPRLKFMEKNPGLIDLLRRAKAESDRGNYPLKHTLLMEVLRHQPGSFRG